MAPVAGMLKERGFHVTGSDVNVYPPASTLLDSLGIPWNEGFREENLRPVPDLVVIGNVIARGNPELEVILDEKIPYCSMPQLIENYLRPRRTFDRRRRNARQDHHHRDARLDFSCRRTAAGFPRRRRGAEFQRPQLRTGRRGRVHHRRRRVRTAFFDRGPKFLHYHPDELILTSLEYDHADIYPDLESIALQFRRLVNLVPRRGRVLIWGESAGVEAGRREGVLPRGNLRPHARMDWCAGDILWHDNATEFRVVIRGREVARIPHADRGTPQCAGRGRGHRGRRMDAASNASNRDAHAHVSKRPPPHGN